MGFTVSAGSTLRHDGCGLTEPLWFEDLIGRVLAKFVFDKELKKWILTSTVGGGLLNHLIVSVILLLLEDKPKSRSRLPLTAHYYDRTQERRGQPH